jgi:hypothetical protein
MYYIGQRTKCITWVHVVLGSNQEARNTVVCTSPGEAKAPVVQTCPCAALVPVTCLGAGQAYEV